MAPNYKSGFVLIRRFSESWGAVAVCALLVGAVLIQRWEMTHPKRVETLKTGVRLAPVALRDMDNRSVEVGWDKAGPPTIIYVFTPTCIWCKRNLSSMKTLAQASGEYRFIGLSPTFTGLKEYLNQNHVTFPVFVASGNAKGIAQLKLGGTPETIVVSGSGTVQKVWVGAYSGTNAAEIEKTFHVKLPEVKAE